MRNLEKPLHGIQSPIQITKDDLLFQDLPNEFQIGHYHSWVIDENISDQIEITALDQNNSIMAIRHKEFDVRGVQFHPESILTEYGKRIIQNWLTKSKLN